MNHLAGSQEQLVDSIVRKLDLVVPQHDPDIAHAVEGALLREACESERTLALGRTAVLTLYLLFTVVAALSPDVVGLEAMPAVNIAAAAVWLAAALAFLVALLRGFYHKHLRRAVPAADAVLTVAAVALLEVTLRPWGGVPSGAILVGVTACALIAFSGSLRLSRSSARFTTAVAAIAALAVAVIGDMTPLESVFLGAAVLATGLLSGRLTRVIRSVITNEIARVQLGRMLTEAREIADARKQALGTVSHELKNPLSVIGMRAEWILETSDPTEREKSVRTILRVRDDMDRLVQDLFDLTKLEAGSVSLNTEDLPAGTLLEEVVDAQRLLVEQAGLTLTAAADAALPSVCVDQGRIRQVLRNLITNASKFTPSGGSITLYGRVEEKFVRIAVIDTGPGIPSANLHDIFGRFWQEKPSDGRGLGLGLTICKAIVEAHGGRIGVESTPGEGTEFWFTVPIAGGKADS